MATKKRIVEAMTAVLKESNMEVCLTNNYQYRLRNGRWGYQAYCICYNDGEIVCRPWSGANMYWKARLEERLTKKEIEEIWKWVWNKWVALIG